MSTKFLLIPEDMYKGLLSASVTNNNISSTIDSNLSKTNNLNKTRRRYPSIAGAPYDDNINLLNVKSKLDSIRKNKSKKPYEANALYNQELSRYLKLRKDANDKPVKVELTNGAKIITKAGSPPSLPPPKIFNQSTRKKRTKTGSLPNFSFTEPSPANLLLPEDEKDEITPVGKVETSSTFSSVKKDANFTTPLKKTKESFLTPLTTKANQSPLTGLQKKNVIDQRIDEIYEYLQKNRALFQIDEHNKLFNNSGLVVKTSDVKESIRRLLDTTQKYSHSPAGHNYLKSRLKKDPVAMQLINKPLELPEGHLKSGRSFKPNIWKRE